LGVVVHTGRHSSSFTLSTTKAADEQRVFPACAVREPVTLTSEELGSREKACWLPQWLPCLADTEAKLVNEFQANPGGC